MSKSVRIGTAGWAIPRLVAQNFADHGSGLERYSAVFDAAEINSTFRKDHRPTTLDRWASTVPDDFRFSIKMPKLISHMLKLRDANDAVCHFAESLHPLGKKAGPWLLQLPPSLAFDDEVARSFFGHLRGVYSGALVLEPRHDSWFEDDVETLLQNFGIERVAADPARILAAARPGGVGDVAYFRLHGSPRVYYSSYEPSFLAALAGAIKECTAKEIWCIFDNTASGAATSDALTLQIKLRPRASSTRTDV